MGNADGSSDAFAKGFERLGEQLYPGHHFRLLEPTSPIYTSEGFPRDRWPSKPPVRALTNGTRELLVLFGSGDPARIWQGRTFLPIKQDAYGQMMLDLFLYSIDTQGLRKRNETYIVTRRDDVKPSKPVRVARLQYAGNWDPEPGGWRRLANTLHNDRVAELDVQPVDPSAADSGGLTSASFALASLTVASADFKLSGPAREAIRQFVAAGGTVLVDVAGGRSAYRYAAEEELAKLFPDAPRQLPVLPPESPVFSSVKGVDSLGRPATVTYRHFDRPAGALHRPQLRGLPGSGGRIAVFYSPEDVSVGLVGEPVGGVSGYVPSDATKIVAATIQYAASHKRS